jgi:hypothetical protein
VIFAILDQRNGSPPHRRGKVAHLPFRCSSAFLASAGATGAAAMAIALERRVLCGIRSNWMCVSTINSRNSRQEAIAVTFRRKGVVTYLVGWRERQHEESIGNGRTMREPRRIRNIRFAIPAPNGLILTLYDLHSILSALGSTSWKSAKADSGAQRMPRPCYRWSRRRGVHRFARLRKPAVLVANRLSDADRPETPTAGIRHELVSRVRKEIDAGTYDDPAKLETALERMLNCLSDD